MKRVLVKMLFLVAVSVLAGCSTAGPFVTGISSNGQGGVVVEKSMVEYNAFLGVVSTKDTSSSVIQIIPAEKLK